MVMSSWIGTEASLILSLILSTQDLVYAISGFSMSSNNLGRWAPNARVACAADG